MDEAFGPAALAIYTGELDDLQRQLVADPELATRISSVGHRTLLQLVACEASSIENAVGAVEILVGAGAATHAPLVSAAGCGSRDVLEWFLNGGIPVDGEDPVWTPLDEALYWANTDIADLLVARGANVRALSTAAGLGDSAAIDRLVSDKAVSADAGPIGSPFPDTVPNDLANDPTSILDHAFVMAVNVGQQNAAARLIDEGATINATPPGYHWRGAALHAAVWRGNRELVEWLLSLGADPTLRDGLADSDAAGWAQHHGHAGLVELFAVRGQ